MGFTPPPAGRQMYYSKLFDYRTVFFVCFFVVFFTWCKRPLKLHITFFYFFLLLPPSSLSCVVQYLNLYQC